ncbi:MAG: hypothetical protein ACK6CT_07240 [Planctomycetia bacterium]
MQLRTRCAMRLYTRAAAAATERVLCTTLRRSVDGTVADVEGEAAGVVADSTMVMRVRRTTRDVTHVGVLSACERCAAASLLIASRVIDIVGLIVTAAAAATMVGWRWLSV